MNDDPLTDAERAFLALRADPQAFAAWGRKVNDRWERAHGVEWFHPGPDGQGVWLPYRPEPVPDHSPLFRFNAQRAAQYAAKVKQARLRRAG